MRKEFHEILKISEAKEAYFKEISPKPVGKEVIPLCYAHNRVLSKKIVAEVDVPSFDRAIRDGYAVIAKDTFFADEENPVKLKVMDEKIFAGKMPKSEVKEGFAVEISTGAVLPRGANAVVMVEDTDEKNGELSIYSPASPGENMMHAGSDIMAGELLIFEGTVLAPNSTAVIASQGIKNVEVCKKPKIGVISTGDEITNAGEKLVPGNIYDVNSRLICDFIKENGCDAKFFGIIKDSQKDIEATIKKALECDAVILSGGTSAGAGDVCYKALESLGRIIVHGVAVKPGKPVVLGKIGEKPVIILPGFPTSAAIMFKIFVSPLIRLMAGLSEKDETDIVEGKVPVRINSEKGKYEYLLVHLVKQGDKDNYSAYPVSKNSGSITAFSFADGFIEIEEEKESIFKDETAKVTLLSKDIGIADLNFIGSHCVMLEPLVSMLKKEGIKSKVIHIGSSSGLEAARREESDITGTHLLDGKTGKYNLAFVENDKNLLLVRGYVREQGILFRKELEGRKALEDFLLDKNLRMINRNKGSGTRVLLDLLIKDIAKNKGVDAENIKSAILGYDVESNNHNSVALAILQKKADYGLAIKTVAHEYGLGFIPLKDEDYDFAIPKPKLKKESVKKFIEILGSNDFRRELSKNVGIKIPKNMGKVIWEG